MCTRRYKNTWDCLKQLIRNEGVASLAIGLGPTLWRNCVWDSIYLAGMYNIDQHVPKPDSVVLRTVQDGVLGCSMGMLATCFNAPFDVVKSRFQAQLPGQERPYTTTLGSLYRIVSEEGVQAAYRGLAPKALRTPFCRSRARA